MEYLPVQLGFRVGNCMSIAELRQAGFDIEGHAFAMGDFSEPLEEICRALMPVSVEAVEGAAEGKRD